MLRRAKQHFANFIRVHGSLGIIRVDDPDLDVRQRYANRAEFVGPLHGVHAARHHPFGQRIPFDKPRTGQRLELTLGFRHQCSGAGETQLDRAQIYFPGAHVGMIEDRVVERWNAVEERRFHLTNRFHHSLQMI